MGNFMLSSLPIEILDPILEDVSRPANRDVALAEVIPGRCFRLAGLLCSPMRVARLVFSLQPYLLPSDLATQRIFRERPVQYAKTAFS